MSEPELVSVIIPNWNGKKFLAGCLDSLKAQTYKNHEVVLVDNGSVDGSVELVESSYPDVRLIRYPVNTGFSVAVNRGIKEARGKLIALLNNDTVVDPAWISEMVQGIKRSPELGSVACKMLAYDDRSLLDGAGDGYRRGGLPGRIGHREKDIGQFNSERYVFGCCGGAALYRRELFDKIGFFDEDYFAYLEDIDLGLRAQSAGYKCLYLPRAIVYHLGCGTTGSGYSPLVVTLSARNNINTIVKNIPLLLLIKFLPQIIYWQAFYLAVVVVRGGQLWPWLKGVASAIAMLPRMLNKRAAIEKMRTVSVEYLESVIVDSESELTASKTRLYKEKSLTQAS
jgi:GT2 family glycosyltransferase